MAIKYGKKKTKQHNILYTIVTAILLCAVFLAMVSYLYNKTEEEEYESLHVQTKQIKDDIILQLTSDRENLATMANFAAKLYSDGDDYSLLFDSFKSIGMIENIGILNPDNTFATKAGTTNMEGAISFEEEKEKTQKKEQPEKRSVQKKNKNSIENLFAEPDKALLLGLIMLLKSEKADEGLIMALTYILS